MKNYSFKYNVHNRRHILGYILENPRLIKCPSDTAQFSCHIKSIAIKLCNKQLLSWRNKDNYKLLIIVSDIDLKTSRF